MNTWTSLILGAALVTACFSSEYLIMSRFGTATVDSGLYKVSLDGSGQQLILNLTYGAIAAAYDSGADALFYVELEQVEITPGVQSKVPSIRRCNINGENVQLLQAGAGGTALAADPDNQKLYYINDFSDDRTGDIRLNVMNYDGSNAVTIYPDPSLPRGARVFGMALDRPNQKVYLSRDDKIMAVKVDGTGEELLLDAAGGPKSVALDELSGKLYFSNPPAGVAAPNLGLNVLTIKTKTRIHLPLTYDMITAIAVIKNQVCMVSGPVGDYEIRSTSLTGAGETVITTGDGGTIITISAPVLPADGGDGDGDGDGGDGDGGDGGGDGDSGDAGVAMTSSLATTLSALLFGLLTIICSAL